MLSTILRATGAIDSPGVTNSQTPPVISVSSRSRLSAGALPTPMVKIRSPLERAAPTTPAWSQISPSVMRSMQGTNSPKDSWLPSTTWLMVDNRAERISVPPIEALVPLMSRPILASFLSVTGSIGSGSPFSSRMRRLNLCIFWLPEAALASASSMASRS